MLQFLLEKLHLLLEYSLDPVLSDDPKCWLVSRMNKPGYYCMCFEEGSTEFWKCQEFGEIALLCKDGCISMALVGSKRSMRVCHLCSCRLYIDDFLSFPEKRVCDMFLN